MLSTMLSTMLGTILSTLSRPPPKDLYLLLLTPHARSDSNGSK